MKNKILNKKNIAKFLQNYRLKRKKIVHCHGVFDLLHLGHFEHFLKAKSFGDILIVSVTSDRFVNKGPNQPFFSLNERIKALSHIESIDHIIESNSPDAIEIIKSIKPDIYCKGKDYQNSKEDLTGKIKKELDLVKSNNGKIVFTDEISFSSSRILNANNLLLNEKQTQFINEIKKIYNFDHIKKSINNFKKLKVLIIGELIIDKYVFCDAVGKSGKDPMLVFSHVKTDEYLGGAGAVANHISDFSENITLLSLIGDKNDRFKFITQQLSKKIKTKFFKKELSPTIIKTRFVDNNSKHKMLGVYDINSEPLSINTSIKVENFIKKNIKKFDIVLAYDYGHGFFNDKIAKLISLNSKYLALNAQVNSSSIGGHSIQKYKKSDFLIINESELRHEVRDNISTVEELVKKLEKKLLFKECVVTRGMKGSLMYSKKHNKFNYCPAFASNVIDKIGAGDSFLPFYSLSSILKNDSNLSLFLGSIAAAQSVESIGNSYNINKSKMLKSISHIIK